MTDWKKKYFDLKESHEVLQEHINILSEANKVPGWTPDPVLGLTITESKILHSLLNRAIITADQLYYCIYGSTLKDVQKDTITVFISNIRKKLKPHALEIVTMLRDGYYITPKTRELLMTKFNFENQFIPPEQYRERLHG